MLGPLEQALKAGDLRQRVLFTLLMFAVFRLGVYVPVPGVNVAVLQEALKNGTLFNLLNLFSGGAFFTFSVFAMGVLPYVNASIIMQLLQQVFPRLEELSKEGLEGQKKLLQYSRYGTVILGFIQSVGVTISLARLGALLYPGVGSVLLIALILTAGTVLLMWIGEMITEYGIGNGISLIIFAGIVARLPASVGNLYSYLTAGTISIGNLLALVVIGLLVIAFVVLIQEAERRVPVQYARRIVGRRMYSGMTSHIPLKVNQAGVIPPIFAISILALPVTLLSFWHAAWLQTVAGWLAFGSAPNVVLEFLLVVAFTFFYTGIIFKPYDIADNIRKAGGFIPGIRPGGPTGHYLERISQRITVVGALFLALITVLPAFVLTATGVPNIYFGGTALLIVVGVALDTMKQIQAQLLMRHYQGFLK